MKNKFPKGVYYITSDGDDTVLVGLNISVTGDTIRWFDTTKERSMQISRTIEDSEKKFVFERSEGGEKRIYTIVPLDLETYNTIVREQLSNAKEFTDLEAMTSAFEQTLKDAW